MTNSAFETRIVGPYTCWIVLRLIAAAALLPCALQIRASAQSSSCPLTESQSQNAVAAFNRIADFVLNEPRCVNCHGGVNPYIKGTGLNPQDPTAPASLTAHGGGAIRKNTDGTIEAECKECHNNMANKRDGSPTEQWMTAANFHSFVDKDAITLCRQFKKSTGNAQEFLGHIKDDNGGNNFAQTAFNGNRGLNADQYLDPDGPTYVAPRPPSISHDAFLQLGQDWVSAMGGKFQGDETCGCELKYPNWSGQITFRKPRADVERHSELDDYSSSEEQVITVNVQNGRSTYHAHIEKKGRSEKRQRVFPGGVGIVFNDTWDEAADGESDCDVRVMTNEVGKTYTIFFGGLIGANGQRIVPPRIGMKHLIRCNKNGCSTTQEDVYMPISDWAAPLSGQLQDSNHIHTSVMIAGEVMTVTLSRSQSRSGGSKYRY